MKFKIGDTVRFLNETGGGKITRIDNKGYIYVMTDDGFEIPVSGNELILKSPAFDNNEIDIPVDTNAISLDKPGHKRSAAADKAEMSVTGLPGDVPFGNQLKLALGLVPEDIEAVFKTTINSYLINDSDFFLYYMIGYQRQGKYYYLKSGEIEPNTKCFLSDFDQTRLGKITLFHIQALPVCTGQYHKILPLDEEINISRHDFLKNHIYKVNDYFDEKALILSVAPVDNLEQKKLHVLSDDDTDDGNTRIVQDSKPGLQAMDSMEVDLHIEALREDFTHLSNGEILRIQMSRFRSALEDAISNKIRRIVFIHGVGNGTLKLELRNELKRSYPEYTYQDASFKEYGFGATMVHLR